MPRVLQVVLTLSPGGTERLVIELARRLHGEMPAAVCCLDDEGAWAAGLRDEGIAVTALGRRAGFRPGLGLALAAVARAHRADVLHAHHYSPFVYSAIAKLRQPRLRVIFTEHGRLSDAAPSSKRRLVNRVFATAASGVFAVSGNVREHLLGEGWRPDDVRVIYNGIQIGPLPAPAERTRVRADLGAGDDTMVIGTIARLDPVKDLGTLLDAAARAGRDTRVQVVVVGDGPVRKDLEARAAALGIAPRVRFLGQRDDARTWLAGCDLYVNSSISEGVSLTILEAMAAGLPVIATKVGGTPEVVNETCGRLVPARDAGGLAAEIVALARDPAGRATLGRAARQRVEAEFTIERMVSEYAAVYRGAAPPSPRLPTGGRSVE
jgi:glycosyltransferase involved in cell wall biosynthesis